MLEINLRKRVFHLFPVTFFALLVWFGTSVNAQQKPPATSEAIKPAAPETSCRTEYERLYKAYSDSPRSISREKRREVLQAGRQIIEKCEDDPENQEVIEYLKKRIPEIESREEFDDLISRFNDSIKDKKTVNVNEAFATGKNPKNNPNIYQAIGDYYKDEYNRLDEERQELAIKAMGNKFSEAELKPLREKAKELLARQKRYGEKMFDAYARLYHLGGQDKADRDTLYTTLKIIYGFVSDGKKDGFEEYLKSISPMPEPLVE